jgi:hypothetical protein
MPGVDMRRGRHLRHRKSAASFDSMNHLSEPHARIVPDIAQQVLLNLIARRDRIGLCAARYGDKNGYRFSRRCDV